MCTRAQCFLSAASRHVPHKFLTARMCAAEVRSKAAAAGEIHNIFERYTLMLRTSACFESLRPVLLINLVLQIQLLVTTYPRLKVTSVTPTRGALSEDITTLRKP